MTRRLRVTMLNANWCGSWSAYWPMFSNHSRLACAARWVEATTGRRSASYAASAASTPACSCRQAARASASSMASLVPEPMEKCAVCAASPSSTTFRCRQASHRTVVKLTHRELFANSWCPPSTSAHRPRIISIDASSLCPGAQTGRAPTSPNPARRHTSSCISRMKVLARSLYG